MTETLEQEVLETETKAQTTFFETTLFRTAYDQLQEYSTENESRIEIRKIMENGLHKFLEKQFPNTSIPYELVNAAYYAGLAVSLGSRTAIELDYSELFAKAMKRIIRKENMLGFNIKFADGTSGGVIIQQEDLDKANKKGIDLKKLIEGSTNGREVIEYSEMSADELNEILDISADKILKGEFNE